MAYNTYNYQPYTSGYNTVNTPYQPQQQAAPMQTQQTAQTGGYICRPVTCREEAVAAQVDYFSAGLVMLDLAHGVIYLKRFDPNTGASSFHDFKYAPPAPPMESGSIDTSQFITRKEFDEFARRMQSTREVQEFDTV